MGSPWSPATPGAKYWSFDSSRRGFDGKAGQRNWGAGAAGVRVQNLIVDDYAFAGIGGERRRDRRLDRDCLGDCGELAELQIDLSRSPRQDRYADGDRSEGWIFGHDPVLTNVDMFEAEVSQ